ncbi:TPA: DapH/DapD/GlmU-related protein [Vibrio vulnificus]|uniref:acyltransferase n=1 Tax=Vibrio vulnificus TaxID=672 RepID=UPI00287A7CD5|nr:acyltransferase [Vibrio vulnificus]EIE1228049.1 acyltransferase [Vibrio vulnificus]MDS1832131.1 acyltransferase [Vibrio vulnificus]
MNKIIRVLMEEVWSLYQVIFLFIPGRIGHRVRGFFLGLFFQKKGKGTSIKENVEIYKPSRLSIGDYSGIGRNNIIDCSGGISIGSNTRLGPNIVIATMNHASRGKVIGSVNKTFKEVCIGDNCWIGAGVTILPGVRIGNNCIIAAGAVVTSNVEQDTCVAGVPARKI